MLSVSGPEARTYLQGQCSQDLAPLGVGDTTETLILSPQGKVDAWVRVTRTAEESFVLDTDPGCGPAGPGPARAVPTADQGEHRAAGLDMPVRARPARPPMTAGPPVPNSCWRWTYPGGAASTCSDPSGPTVAVLTSWVPAPVVLV